MDVVANCIRPNNVGRIAFAQIKKADAIRPYGGGASLDCCSFTLVVEMMGDAMNFTSSCSFTSPIANSGFLYPFEIAVKKAVISSK